VWVGARACVLPTKNSCQIGSMTLPILFLMRGGEEIEFSRREEWMFGCGGGGGGGAQLVRK
jgi:hypothetical protein